MNDDKRTRYTRRSALGLMALGGGFTAMGTLGFSQTTSERDTTIAVDDDGNALLGIKQTDETSGTVEFTNRASEEFSVDLSSDDSVEFDVGGSSMNPQSFPLPDGTTESVDIVPTSGSEPNNADVNITATLSSTTISATRTFSTGSK